MIKFKKIIKDKNSTIINNPTNENYSTNLTRIEQIANNSFFNTPNESHNINNEEKKELSFIEKLNLLKNRTKNLLNLYEKNNNKLVEKLNS